MKSKYTLDSGMYWGSKFITNECYGKYWAEMLIFNGDRLRKGFNIGYWLKIEELCLIAAQVLEEV